MHNRRPRGRLIIAAGMGALLVLLHSRAVDAGSLKQVRVAEYGHNATNTIKSPILTPEGIAPLVVGKWTAGYDPKAKIVRGLGGLFTKGPTLDLDRRVNLADLFADSLRSEAHAMGYPNASAETPGAKWELSGDLQDMGRPSHSG